MSKTSAEPPSPRTRRSPPSIRHRLSRPMLLALCLGVAAAAAEPAPPLQPVVSGTVHEALYGIAAHGEAMIAVGAGGAILESGDAGRSWKAAAGVPTSLALLAVAIADGHAIAVGQVGTVLVMDERGAWIKADSGTNARLFGVGVNASGRAVAVGAFGTAVKSEDGGHSWSSIAPDWKSFTASGEQPHLYGAVVDHAGVITVAGEFGLILRSTDGGASWKQLHKGDASLFAIDLHDPAAGFAVGQNGTILRSVDGGVTWTQVESGSSAILLGVRAIGSGRVVVTAMRDLLESRDGGLTWHDIARGEATTSWYQSMATAPQQQEVFAVGHSGQIIRVGN